MEMKEAKRLLESISYWTGCDLDTAERMLYGVVFWNGDNHSAYLDEEGKLIICRNGYIIHKISMM